MKLASYLANGRAAFGVVTSDGVITMNERLGGRAASLKEALALGLIPQIADAAAAQAAAGAKPDHKLADITFLPAIPDPELIACAGINVARMRAKPGATSPSSRACSSAAPIRCWGTTAR